MRHPLDGVQAKLDRAYEHGEALYEQTAAFLKEEPYHAPQEVRVDKRPEVLVVDGILRVRKEPPAKLGVIAGDFAHNLRGSLDHLVYQLALIGGKGKAPGGTAFPIAKTESEYVRPQADGGPSLRDRSLAGLLDEHRALIDAEQPYHAGPRAVASRHPLAVLSAFSNRDKHRLIHAVVLKPQKLTVRPLQGDFECEFIPPKGVEAVAEGARLYTLRISNPTQPEVRMKVMLNFTLGFGTRGLEPEQMRRLWLFVSGIIDKFRPIFG